MKQPNRFSFGSILFVILTALVFVGLLILLPRMISF